MSKVLFYAGLCCIYLYFLGCISEPSDNANVYYKPGEIGLESQSVTLDSSEVHAISIGYNDLKLIGRLERKTKPVTEKELESIGCKDWLFQEEDLEGLLKRMEKVDPVQWNMLCYEYPCYYEGKVRNKESEYTIIINSASYVKLYNNKEIFIFIYKQKVPIFLTPCDCCE